MPQCTYEETNVSPIVPGAPIVLLANNLELLFVVLMTLENAVVEGSTVSSIVVAQIFFPAFFRMYDRVEWDLLDVGGESGDGHDGSGVGLRCVDEMSMG